MLSAIVTHIQHIMWCICNSDRASFMIEDFHETIVFKIVVIVDLREHVHNRRQKYMTNSLLDI